MGGAEKSVDPEKIQRAEAAVTAATEHARKLPFASPGVASSVSKAFNATLDLVKEHGMKVTATLLDLSLSRSSNNTTTSTKKLVQLEDVSSGHEVPPFVMTRKGAEEHSEALTTEAEMVIARNPSRVSSELSYETSSSDMGFFDRNYSIPENDPGSSFVSRLVSEAELVSGWLVDSYLGDVISDRFKKTPPVITFEPISFFDAQEKAYGYLAVGFYFPDTNHIALDRNLDATQNSIADTSNLIAHEYLHYAAYLGGGTEIRFTDSEGNYHSGENMNLSHEGLTELHAQNLVHSHGMSPSHVSYAPEVLSISLLQHIVGKEVLKEAYLTGNFTKIAELVDEKLGNGTFTEFMYIFSSSPLDALVFLQNYGASAKIDLSAWAENPIVRQAKKDLGVTE